MALYDTVLNIVSDVAVELGLGSLSAIYSSTDANVIQLRTLLKSTGRGLVLKTPWLQAVKEHTFVTDANSSYTLPADFQSMVDGSGWNRTSRYQLQPLTRPEWQAVVASVSQPASTYLFKPKDLTIEVWPQPPTSGETIAFEYRSRHWVALTGSTTPTKDAPTLDTDVVCLDVQLITRALKLAFLRAKGFDSTAAQQDFLDAYEDVRSANANAAPVLDLNGRLMGDRLLDESNAPSTGFGLDGLGGLH